MKPALLVLLLAFPFYAKAQFGGPHPFFTNNYQTWLLDDVADVDADGDPDLITRSNSIHTVLLGRNDGEGNFTEEVLANGLYFRAMLDFDGDGRPEMLAVDSITQNLELHWLTPEGTLSDSALFVTPPLYAPTQSFLNDMNQDGYMDFILTFYNGTETHLVWMKNNGFNQFNYVPLEDFPAPQIQVSLADLNHDGFTDICVASYWQNRFGWYPGDGTGFVGDFIDLQTGMNPAIQNVVNFSSNGLLPADFDGDGDEDLICWSEDQQKIIYMPNAGGGDFPEVRLVSDTLLPFSFYNFLKIADADGDQDLDILVLSNHLSLLKNDGAGNFNAERNVTLGLNSNTQGLHWQDLDGDGDPDPLTWRFDEVFYFPNDGEGNSGQQHFVLTNIIPEPETIAVTDIDKDGLPDFAFGSKVNGMVGWRPQLLNGGFGELRLIHTLDNGFQDVAFVDLNGDSLPEALCVSLHLHKMRIYPNQGIGKFGPYVDVEITNGSYSTPDRVHGSDTDGDGDQDVFVSGGFDTGFQLKLLKNDGAGQLSAPDSIAFLSYQGYCLEEHPDIDGDGDPDLFYQEAPNALLYWCANDGAGHYGPAQWLGQYFDLLHTLPVELNQDTLPDLLIASTDGGLYWAKNVGGGQSFSKQPIQLPTGANFFAIAAADFDRDGDNDIWASSRVDSFVSGNRIFIYNNDGTGQFNLAYSFETRPVDHWKAQAADVDADGDPDVFYGAFDRNGWYENLRRTPLISGFCFHDLNENGQYEQGEPFISDIALEMQPNALQTYAQANGSFKFYTSYGPNVLTYRPHPCWILTSDSAQYHLNYQGQLISGLFFGFTKDEDYQEIEPQIADFWARCDLQVPVWFNLKNIACSPTDGWLAVSSNEFTTFVSADIPVDSMSGDTLWWRIVGIAPSQTFSFKALFQVASAENIGDTARISCQFYSVNAGGDYIESGSDFTYSIVGCSYDPNDKLVDRRAVEVDYLPETSELRYTVRFQNTGNDLAYLVRIFDQLDTNLDWTSIRPLGSSHPNEMTLDLNTGVLDWYFENINLPDSGSNWLGSQGYASFAIRMKPGLPAGMVVENTADIYFDSNPAIVTNTAETRIFQPMVSVYSAPQVGSLLIMPNPNSGVFSVQIPRGAEAGMRIRMVDLAGRLMLENTVSAGSNQVQLNAQALPSGMYLLQLVENGRVMGVGKVVKE